METAHNLILVGGTGTGKSHLATAIGVVAIHQGKRVRFFNAVDLVNQLEREKSQGRAGYLAKQLCLVDAVILDELGYLPFPASGGALLFHLISHLYEKTLLVVTTNLSFELLAKLFLKRSAMAFDARISASKWLRFPFSRQPSGFTAFPRHRGRTLSPAKPV